MKKSTKLQWIPCFLCGNSREVRKSKREKPYIVCDPCGVQIFVRREEGIKLLNGLMRTLSSPENFDFNAGIGNPQLLALVNRMDQLREKYRELDSRRGIFDWEGANQEIQIAMRALDREIDRLKEMLEVL